MTDSRVALGMDRLPWLPDEPAGRTKPRGSAGANLFGWAVAGMLAVAGLSYWLGTRAGSDQPATGAEPSATLALPEAKPAEPQTIPQLPSPEIRRVAEPEVRRPADRSPAIVRPSWKPLPRTVPNEVAERVERTMATQEMDKVADAQGSTDQRRRAAKPAAPMVPNTQAVKLWPARQSAGATGRVVQIGAFGTRLQAKLGWKHMARAYPGVKRLPAVVVETRNSRGRPFYRFQIGTTSQAHSEILCQRMERIRFSCAVVGLPGAKQAVER